MKKIRTYKKTAFCFFPTKKDTQLNFLINAPFLLTANRESILANKEENKQMIKMLSKLAGDSLIYLRDIGEKESIRYIDDDILDIVPIKYSLFECNENDQISFLPFYTQIKNKFNTEKLLPTKSGYVTKENAYWSDIKRSKELFSNEQIGMIFRNDSANRTKEVLGGQMATMLSNLSAFSAEWVFFDRNDNYTYIRDIVKYVADYDLLNNITKNFIESQSIEWLDNFYDWIKSDRERINRSKTKPIFLNEHKEAVATYIYENYKYKNNLFLPSNNISFGCNTVYEELFKCKSAKILLKELDVREPNIQDELELVLSNYKNAINIDSDNTCKMLFEVFEKEKNISSNSIICKFKDVKFLKYYFSGKNLAIYSSYDKGSEIYFPSDDLKEFFKTKTDTKFLDSEHYKKLLKIDDKKLKEFVDYFEVQDFPKIIKIERDISEVEIPNFFASYLEI